MVSEAWNPNAAEPHPPMVEFTALWDTGASGSVISQAVVDACGLKATGALKVYHAQGATEDVPSFLVNIKLPNNVEFPGLTVSLGNLSGTEVLIGMDIIGSGDFAVTHRDNKTKFSFRIPSQADIDFVAEDKERSKRQHIDTLLKAKGSTTPGPTKRGRRGKKGKRR